MNIANVFVKERFKFAMLGNYTNVKKCMRFWAALLFSCIFLVSCASQPGRDTVADVLSKINIGISTKRDVKGIFGGIPVKVKYTGDDEEWLYIVYRGGWNLQCKGGIEIVFSKEGVVKSFTRITSFEGWSGVPAYQERR